MRGNIKTKHDLAERTAVFAESVINLAKKIQETSITRPIIVQLVKSGTSVAANYCEADDSLTKKEFIHRIGICRRESREAKFWLRMVVNTVPRLLEFANPLSQEAHELNLIFSSIAKRSSQS